MVLQPAAVAAPGCLGQSGPMWLAVSSSTISWTCGSPQMARSTIIKVLPSSASCHRSLFFIVLLILFPVFVLCGHQGLQAGDNTLNVLCSLRAARGLVSGGFTDLCQPDARAAVLSDYVQFMTTPGSHRDTYAESFHRSFFADWQETKPTLPREVKQKWQIQLLKYQTWCLLLIYSLFSRS